MRTRGWLHLLLLGLTYVTLSLTGGIWWDGYRAPENPSWIWLFLNGQTYALSVLAILGSHEMGHYLACRYYRIPATLPFFIPGLPVLGTFGAVIRIRGRIPDRRALFDVAAAGPIAGFVVAFPILLLGYLRADAIVTPVDGGGLELGRSLLVRLIKTTLKPGVQIHANGLIGAGWVGMLVTSLNLFPVGQLDGGHAAYAVSRRLHRFLARLTIVAMVALLVWQALYLRQIPAYLLWIAILLFMRDRHPYLLDERAPLGNGRLAVALLLALIFVLAFIPIPFYF